MGEFIKVGGSGGSSTFDGLSDKATVDLPVVNTPLANALSGKEDTSNKKTDVDANKTSDTFFPTVKAVFDWVNGLFVKGVVSSTDNAIARFDGTTGKLVQNSNVIIDDSGSVGIGTVAPTAKLELLSGVISATNKPSLKVSDTCTSLLGYDNFSLNISKTVSLASTSSASDYGAGKFDVYTDANTGRYINGIDVSTRMGGNATYSNSIGMSCRVGTSNAFSSLTNAIGIQTSPYCLAGSITNFIGLKVTKRVFTSGTVANAYGIYIEDVDYGTSSNYSLYIAGGKSYINGDVGIGTPSPTAKVDVSGTSRFRDNATFNGQIIDNAGSSGTDGQVLKKVGGLVLWSNP